MQRRNEQTSEENLVRGSIKNSATGTRTRVARVRAEYPNQLDYEEVVKSMTSNVTDLMLALATQPASVREEIGSG